jgi:glycosyltransferase involved in cell wall biosynthesis
MLFVMLIIISKWGDSMKYSFIIPVYNGEKYIDKCLESILNQNYNNYEVIIINDGSTDSSLEILENYAKENKNIKLYSTKNNGLSNARNHGITKVTGDYFIFVDIDDYVDKNMLGYLNKQITQNNYVDLIKYDYIKVYSDDDVKSSNTEGDIEVLNGYEAFRNLVNKKVPFELACIYAYKTDFWCKNKFKFEPNRYHEDFGLLPYIINKADKVLITNKVLYYYVQSNNSITRNDDNEKQVKKMDDIIYHFDNLYKKINNDKAISTMDKAIFNSYIANAVLDSYRKLNKEKRKPFREKIIDRNIINLLLDNNILRKFKKLVYKFMI